MRDPIQEPIPVKELDKYFKPRGALKETPIALERRFHIAADREPQVKTRLERIDRGDNQPHWEVTVDIDGGRAGGRALPPALKGKASRIGKRRISEDKLTQQLTGFIPDHLGFNATPRAESMSTASVTFLASPRSRREWLEATGSPRVFAARRRGCFVTREA